MKRGQLLGVAIAGVCGLGAFYGVLKLVNKQPATVITQEAPVSMAQVLVAKSDIGLGQDGNFYDVQMQPIQRLFKLKDGEHVVAAFSLDPRAIGDIKARPRPKSDELDPAPVHAVECCLPVDDELAAAPGADDRLPQHRTEVGVVLGHQHDAVPLGALDRRHDLGRIR